MKIYLAPMEGVINARMRAMLTAAGGIDRCVTEFVRVSSQLLPPRVFHRFCPELLQGSVTPSGVPVYLQLLGSDPSALADNAAQAATLGAKGIDLNFGCPAKTVNKHRGGSVLLQEPELIHRIVGEVRAALTSATPLTVKIRLGYEDDSQLSDVAQAIDAAGASELVIHARTKTHGYKPPAYWEKIARVNELVSVPIIANGEIWTLSDYRRCVELSGCENIMLGRGMLAQPGLASAIKRGTDTTLPWSAILQLLTNFQRHLQQECDARHACSPLKQWLAYLQLQYYEAGQLFAEVKRINDAPNMLQILNSCNDGICNTLGEGHIAA